MYKKRRKQAKTTRYHEGQTLQILLIKIIKNSDQLGDFKETLNQTIKQTRVKNQVLAKTKLAVRRESHIKLQFLGLLLRKLA